MEITTKQAKKPHFLKTLTRVLGLMWQIDRTLFLCNAGMAIVSGVMPIGISYTFKLVIDAIVRTQNASGVITASLLGLFAFRYAMVIADDVFNAFENFYLQQKSREKTSLYLAQKTSEKISGLDIDYFENSETQNLITKINSQALGQLQTYTSQIFSIGSSVIAFFGAFLVLFPFGWWIPFVLAAVVVPRIVIVQRRVNLTWSIWKENIPAQREANYIREILQKKETVREIRLFGAREELLERHKKMQEELSRKKTRPYLDYFRKISGPIVLESATVFSLIYLQLPSTLAGLLSVGTLTFFIQNADRVLANTASFSSRISRLVEMNMYVGDYFELIDLPPLIKEKTPGHVFDKISPPKIEFQNISFRYLPETPILKKINFSIEPGQHLAIVGPNGAGKSTLIKLLLRFYDPEHGQISVNDFDLKDLKLKNWYQFVGTLFQDFSHYPLSVRDNIRLGNPETVDTERMIEAAKKSGAHEFIEKLPNKYEQRLGRNFEDSAELSQGQWQKLALARAFYEEPPVLILDEPTSAIDAEAEAEIFENLNTTYKDKTLIFVSHRFSTVRNADKIIVLKDGEIAEEGTHQSLMKEDGIYARMFKKQAKGYIE